MGRRSLGEQLGWDFMNLDAFPAKSDVALTMTVAIKYLGTLSALRR